MNIKRNSTIIKTITNTEGRNLRPLNNYDGKLLKLTKSDKTKIAAYEASIAQLECDIYALNKSLDSPSKMGFRAWNALTDKIDYLQFKVDQLRTMIRDIKVNRFNIQKSKQK